MTQDFPTEISNTIQRVMDGGLPEAEQAAAWLERSDLGQLGQLLAAAGRLRGANEGDVVEFCAIVNARSGHCSENCAFCAQSAHHQGQAEVYPLLSAEEMVRRGRAAAEAGAQRFGIVTSGRECPKGEALDEICRAVEVLTSEKVIAPCASLGLIGQARARRLADAGLVRYHHNLEAGPSFFPRICTTHTYEDRVDTVKAAQDAGLEVCVGGIVGLGETPLERVELAQAVAELKPQSIPLNFLTPIPGTPMANHQPLKPLEALATVAVFKLFNPKAVVRTCGGRQQVLGDLAPLMYLAGAGGTMIGNYLTTEGRQPVEDINDLAALGLKPAAKLMGE
ncbi:MAG: biotin synthase BioB [Proteobacteria bacterium]|nr:biotin synthase BioB [Pseudomonadota bacterium]